MRTIKNYVRAALPMLLGCLLFAACSDDDIAEKGVKEGLPASLTFKMVVPDLDDAVVTRAGVEQETALNQLMFLFYKKSDTSKPAFAKVIDQLGQYSIGSDSKDESNRLYTVTIFSGDTDSNGNQLTSGEYYLYALANWQNGFCSYDAEGYASKSLDELKSAILARKSGDNVLDILNNTPMTGIYGREDGSITINEGDNVLGGNDETRVHLRRAVAKVIFNIRTEQGITFTPERYSIYNYSQSSTLMERKGWEGEQGTKPGGLGYSGNGSFSNFEDLAFADNSSNSFEFYMPENVQKAKDSFTDVKMREKRMSESKATFKYAPEKSTYIVIEGHYNGPGVNTEGASGSYDGDVKYTIQLGDFDGTRGGIDNFTIRRNVKYTYNVKVKGVNNIITEAEAKNFDDELQPGAEGDLVRMDDGTIKLDLDAHFERVLLKIPVKEFDNPMFYVNTPYSRTAKGISADMTVADDSKDYKWIHFTKPQTGEVLDGLTFGNFGGSDESARTDVHGLLKEIQSIGDNTNEHFLVKDGYLYTTAYVDEFFYTENPQGGSVSLSDFVNRPGGRTMNICTTKHISADGKSSVVENTIISFSQASIWTVYPTDGSVSIPFGIEKNNEWNKDGNGMTRGSASPSGLNNTDGWDNTKKLINDKNSNNNYDSSAGWVVSVNEGSKADVKFNFSGNYNYSYLAAMSRNRDTNDDGKISDDELKWYVPARNQCIALWLGDNNLGAYRPYNASNLSSATSTDVEGPAGLLHTSSSGNSAVWWAIEGASFGNNNNNNLDMRCIRNLSNGMYNQEPTTFSTCNGKIITLSSLSSSCVRNSIMTGEYAANHKEREYSNTVPLAFEVASGDLILSALDVAVSAKLSTVRRSGSYGDRTDAYTVNLDITNLPENASLTVSGGYTITSINNGYTVSATTNSSSFNFSVYVNGSEICQVSCNPNGVNNNNRDYTFTPTVKMTSSGKSEFTRDEIKTLVNLAAANYTQDADGKDKGQWRVPNQRELVLMLGYWSELDMPTTGTHYASSTFYTATGAGKENPFMIDTYNGNPYMTLYGNYSGNFRIRPVRDVEPSASPQATHDSSYRPGGSIIK